MNGIIIVLLVLIAVYIIFSALNDIITQHHLDMDRTFNNSLRRAEQLAYIWFYEIKPDEYQNAELILFKTPYGEYWNDLPMITVPIIRPLTGKPLLRRDYVTGEDVKVQYDYKKVIKENYLKKYHTSCDLFYRFELMMFRSSLAGDMEKLVWRYGKWAL